MRICWRAVSWAGGQGRLAELPWSRCIASLVGLVLLVGCSSTTGHRAATPAPTPTPERSEVAVAARTSVTVLASDEDEASLLHDVVVVPFGLVILTIPAIVFSAGNDNLVMTT